MPHKDPQVYRDYQRQERRNRRRKRRAEAVKTKGGKCLHCPRTDDLEFHHRDPKTKTLTAGELWDRSWKVILKELEGLDLVCPACHMITDERIDAEDYEDYKDVTSVTNRAKEELPSWVTED